MPIKIEEDLENYFLDTLKATGTKHLVLGKQGSPCCGANYSMELASEVNTNEYMIYEQEGGLSACIRYEHDDDDVEILYNSDGDICIKDRHGLG